MKQIIKGEEKRQGVELERGDLVYLADNMRVREVKTKQSNSHKIRSIKTLIALVTLVNQGKFLELNSWGKVKEYIYEHDEFVYLMGNMPALLMAGRIKEEAFVEFKAKYEPWIVDATV